MKTIPLTKGMVALVDDDTFGFLNQWKWYACECNGRFYARRDENVNKVRRRIYMHAVVAGAVKGQEVDHRDRITLNNQRHNLRKCDRVHNMGNCGMQSHNTSGFKGVSWDKSRQKWMASIKGFGDRDVFLGRFGSAKDAANAYDHAAIEKYGRFALTNENLGTFK